MHIVQALTALVACLQVSSDRAESGASILVTAIRYAYMLNLHRLEEDREMTVADRTERMRCFWCLYCLDRSISLKLHLPPIIDDRDLHVIRPKMLHDDPPRLLNFADPLEWQQNDLHPPNGTYDHPAGLLIASSMFEGSDDKIRAVGSNAILNLFAARQRLAIISGDIWASLHTRTGEQQAQDARRVEETRLQWRLLQWKREWFHVDYPRTEWPPEHLATIVLLQFDYFLCLLKSDPETFPSKSPKEVAMMPSDSRYVLNLQRKVLSGTSAWVDAARETLRLATVVRRGGWPYLQ